MKPGNSEFAAADHPARDGPLRPLRRSRPVAERPTHPPGPRGHALQHSKAKSVIQIWMWGGPAHLDTFDPKPEAGNDYSGPLDKPIETNVSGMRICELLPLLAKQADKYSLIRSMTHGVYAHETASYTVQTGRMSGGRDVYPSVGAVVSLFKGYNAGYKGLIPPYIVLTEPQGRFSEAGLPRLALQALRHRRRSRAGQIRRRRRHRPWTSPTSASRLAASTCTSSTRSNWPTLATRSSDLPRKWRTRPTN